MLRETPGIEQFKITQQSLYEFEILVVCNEDWNSDALAVIANKFKARFGSACIIHIQLVNEIKPEASGKMRQVASKVTMPI